MPINLGPNSWALIASVVIAGITFAAEQWWKPLGTFGKILYGAAVILLIFWGVSLLLLLVN